MVCELGAELCEAAEHHETVQQIHIKEAQDIQLARVLCAKETSQPYRF